MANMKLKDFGKPVLLGSLVVWGAPFISGILPASIDIPLVAGFTVASLASAGLAAFAADMIVEWLM